MIDPAQIHLVTYELEADYYEQTTLALWMRTDENLFLTRDKTKRAPWVILSVHETAEEARAEVGRRERVE